MVISSRYVLVLTIIHLHSKLSSPDSINAVVQGNLLERTEFNFSMSVKDLTGTIMYCIDSTSNQIGLTIEPGNQYEKYISVSFNKSRKLFNLDQFCGCDPCDESVLHFYLSLYRKKISVRCNNLKLILFDIMEATSTKVNLLKPVPSEIEDKDSYMYIMVGDIGPYLTKDARTIFPSKYQLIGCLGTFFYNNNKILFHVTEPNTVKECPQRCVKDVCNEGLCTEIYFGLRCNCSFTARNGLYCDKRFKKYEIGANNSYDVIQNIDHLYIKMSWRQAWHKAYCIMGIIARDRNFTIWINDNRLMRNNADIGENNVDGTNFISINLTDSNLIINTKSHSSIQPISLSETMQINVGFSEYSCETFEGVYDLYFYPKPLFPSQRKYITKQSVSSIPPPFTSPYIPLIHIVILLFVGTSMIILACICMTAALCIIVKRKREENRHRNIIGEAETELGELTQIDENKSSSKLFNIEETRPKSNPESRIFFSNDTLPPLPRNIIKIDN